MTAFFPSQQHIQSNQKWHAPPNGRPSAIDLLERHWGYTEFRFCQQQVIDTILAGQDCLVVMPTGGGKSICYQVGAGARARARARDVVGATDAPSRARAVLQCSVGAATQVIEPTKFSVVGYKPDGRAAGRSVGVELGPMRCEQPKEQGAVGRMDRSKPLLGSQEHQNFHARLPGCQHTRRQVHSFRNCP